MDRSRTTIFDRSAMALSGLCVIHCIAGSLLLTAASFSTAFLGHTVHFVGLLIALPLAAVALWRGVTCHGQLSIALQGALGIGFMAASLAMREGGGFEIFTSVVGVVLLGTAHWRNLRALRT